MTTLLLKIMAVAARGCYGDSSEEPPAEKEEKQPLSSVKHNCPLCSLEKIIRNHSNEEREQLNITSQKRIVKYLLPTDITGYRIENVGADTVGRAITGFTRCRKRCNIKDFF